MVDGGPRDARPSDATHGPDTGADAAPSDASKPEAAPDAAPTLGACPLPTSDPDIQQQLPQTYIDTTYTPPTGRTVAVASGGDLQGAINAALPGDVITIEAGASFTGPFVLPNGAGSGYVTIRTSAPDSSLPPPGTRVTPAFASAMPKILAPNASPAIQAGPGAHHYRFIGIEVTPVDASATIYDLFEIGSGLEATAADLPHDIVLDRVYVHGTPTGYTKRCVQLNGGATAVIDSYVSDCHAVGQDAQAVGGWAGTGPYKIVNDYLEGSGENILFGGADPTLANAVASDIEIRQNHITKPLSWKMDDPSYAGIHWTIKNLLELKNAQRVLVQCNVLEYSWADAQVGFAVVLTPRNSSGGAPWSVVRDVTIQDNVVRHAASGWNILGEDDSNASLETTGIVIRNNLAYDLDYNAYGGDGRTWQLTTPASSIAVGGPGRPTQGLKVAHNTTLQVGNGMVVMGDVVPVAASLFLQDNIGTHANYGIFGGGVGEGTVALMTYAPGYTVATNAIIGVPTPSAYPPNDFYPATPADVGFVSYATGDYHLASGSPYKNAASDGMDIGADIDTVLTATAGVAP